MTVFRPFAVALLISSVPALAAPTFQRLYSNDAQASSFLQSDWNKYTENYHPKYALDDNPKTAWVEGVAGNGEGESLTIRFSLLSSARTVRVRIRNGYQASRGLLLKNSAPKAVTLSLLNAAGEEVFATKATLTRTWGWQQVDLVPPPHAQLAFLKLRIDSTWPGSRYKDTCISDVQLLVDSDVPYNEKAELAKKAALTAWIQDRVATAKYFAALPKAYPFAATDYDQHQVFDATEPRTTRAGVKVDGFVPLDQRVEKGDYPPAWNRLFDKAQTEQIHWLMKLAKERGASLGKSWYRAAFTGRILLPDGLGNGEGSGPLDLVANFLERDNFALFETTPSATPVAWTPPRGVDLGGWEGKTSPLRVELGAPSQPPPGATPTQGAPIEGAPLPVTQRPRLRALYFWLHAIFHERMEDYEETRHVLLMCDEQERPSEVLVLSTSSSGWRVTAVTFTRDSQGRVAQVTERQAGYYGPNEAEGDDPSQASNAFSIWTYSPTAHG